MIGRDKSYADSLVTKWFKNKVINYADMNIILLNLYSQNNFNLFNFLVNTISFYNIPYNQLPLYCKTYKFKKALKKHNYRFNNEVLEYKYSEVKSDSVESV